MLPEVNLLPKYERTESLLYNVFIVGVILLILMSGILAYFYFTTKSELATVEERVESLNHDKELLEASISGMQQVETTNFEDIVAYVDSFSTPTSILVDELITLLPEHGYLSTFTYDFNTIQIETQFETLPDSSTYVVNLLKSRYLKDVEVNQISTFSLDRETGDLSADYDVIPRYHVDYYLEIDHDSFAGEEEENEESVSGE